MNPKIQISNGIDILEIDRVTRLKKYSRFFSRMFTEKEQHYIHQRYMRDDVIAGLLVAKEAVSKALGTGFRTFRWNDIEILHDASGAPVVSFHGMAKEQYQALHAVDCSLSISHSKKEAVALATILRYEW